MQERREIGDLIRIGASASRNRGRDGMITDIERDPQGRPDRDMCTVYLWHTGTLYFLAGQLEKTGSCRIFLSKAA
jgi:hypothetical protein